MRILITGGNGLLGRHLVPALMDRGDLVSVLALPDENTAWLDERGVAVHRGDIREAGSVTDAMRNVEGVVHLAGMMGVWRSLADYRAVNVTGSLNVHRAALAQGVARIVHASSWTVYGIDLGRPADEDFPLAPFEADPYPVTKAEGDRVVRDMVARDGLPAVIVRPGTFFGPGDQLHFGRMAQRVGSKRGVVVGSGRNALPFVYVTDVARGIILALDRGRIGEAYNLSNDEPMTQGEFLQGIADELGVDPPRIHLPYRPLYAAAYAAERAARLAGSSRPPLVTRLGVKLFGTDNRHSIDKARRELGYEPEVSVEQGIRLAADWYRGSTGSAARAQ